MTNIFVSFRKNAERRQILKLVEDCRAVGQNNSMTTDERIKAISDIAEKAKVLVPQYLK